MFVEILCGGYGCCSGKSVHTVMRGEQCEVSEAEGARLIGLGMAKAVPVAANAPEIVPVAAPGASEGNATPPAPKPRRTARRRPVSIPSSCTA